MSSAASQFPENSQPAESSDQSSEQSLARPRLMGPPKRRPAPPPTETPAASQDVQPVAENSSPTADGSAATPSAPTQPTTPTSSAAPADAEPPADTPKLPRQQPISPPSEPMQYRAIGLVRGRYEPSEEQFNRGTLHTADGTEIDTVLLGRVTSLVKNHIELAEPHLWVVYPRTRKLNFRDVNSEVILHLQIVGVWEPETLKAEPSEDEAAENGAAEDEAAESEATVAEAEATAAQTDVKETPEIEAASSAVEEVDTAEATTSSDADEYFSIRGEVVKYNEKNGEILVNIVQGIKRPDKSTKDFRLILQGELSGRVTGYFWDLEVKRQGSDLVVQSGSSVGIVPPKKRKKGEKKNAYTNRRPGSSDRPRSPRSATPKPQKPSLRRSRSEEE